MHPYTTDSHERTVVPLLLAGASMGSAYFLTHVVLAALPFAPPWWIDIPSVVGLYHGFHALFDKYLWRVPVLRRIGLVKVPDLDGTWKGHIASSFDAYKTKRDVTIEIRQSWKQISINLATQNSKSHSLTAAILTENPNAILISYEYLSEPRPDVASTMHAHRGTTRLTLAPDKKALDGEYYSGRDRRNIGALSLRRL